MTELPTVFAAWAAVMNEVQSIGKGGYNQVQKFHFRGIDAVMDAVGPVLRKHGVMVIPSGLEHEASHYETRGRDGKQGTAMVNRLVKVSYTVYGPGGDHFTGVTYGEAADAGDKAVTKAESVALRVFLLQALMILTGDPDPDASSHERATVDRDFEAARDELAAKAKSLGFTRQGMEDKCLEAMGTPVTADKIRAFIKKLEEEAA